MSDLTIGLPVYNGAATLAPTLDALLAQTYDDIIVLASDNASTDNTPDILMTYARRDDRLKFVRQPTNIGASKNFWYLLEAAETPLFGWCAADDVPQPTYIERTVNALHAAPNAMLCCTDIIFVLADGERWKYVENLDTVGCDVESRLHRLLNRQGWYATYGIGRRKRLLKMGRPGERYGADVTWTAKWLCEWEIACVHEPLLHFRFVPKDATAYAIASGSSGPVAKHPFSEMLTDIGATVRSQIPDELVARRLMRSMARTIAFESPILCETVISENGLHKSRFDDFERLKFFYRLLTQPAAVQRNATTPE